MKSNREGFDFPIDGPYQEFPILKSGVYDGGKLHFYSLLPLLEVGGVGMHRNGENVANLTAVCNTKVPSALRYC